MGSGLLAQGLHGGTPRGHRIAVQMQRARASAAWGVLGRYGQKSSFSASQQKRTRVPTSYRGFSGGACARLTPKFAHVTADARLLVPSSHDVVCEVFHGKQDRNGRCIAGRSAACNARRRFVEWEYRKIVLGDHHRRRDDIDLLCELGGNGWELVAITPNNVAYLKREVGHA